MYDIDPTPNSDQQFCPNCECLIDKLDTRETINSEQGCVNCVSRCEMCGDYYFNEELYDCPYFGKICDTCRATDDYNKSVRDSVLKEALRMYFDKIDHKRIERTIIKVARILGYDKLAHEMKNDL